MTREAQEVDPEPGKEEVIVADNPEFFDDPGDEAPSPAYCMFACTGLFDTRLPSDKEEKQAVPDVPIEEDDKPKEKYFPALGF